MRAGVGFPIPRPVTASLGQWRVRRALNASLLYASTLLSTVIIALEISSLFAAQLKLLKLNTTSVYVLITLFLIASIYLIESYLYFFTSTNMQNDLLYKGKYILGK